MREQVDNKPPARDLGAPALRLRCADIADIADIAGMPSPAWRAMYLRLLADLPVGTPVLHWGDVDEGGFRIAAHLSQCAAEAGRKLLPCRMRPSDVPEGLRREAPVRTSP